MPKPTRPGAKRTPAAAKLTAPEPVRYGEDPSNPAPAPLPDPGLALGAPLMSDRAYILINVAPGLTSSVVKSLEQIKGITTVDPCWGKPDIIVVADVPDQDALTQLVMSRIHAIEGVTQTDTHLVYRPARSYAK